MIGCQIPVASKDTVSEHSSFHRMHLLLRIGPLGAYRVAPQIADSSSSGQGVCQCSRDAGLHPKEEMSCAREFSPVVTARFEMRARASATRMGPNMTDMARIALICEGDVETAWSGSVRGVDSQLRQLGHEVTPINARLSGLPRHLAAVCAFSRHRMTWRSRFRHGPVAFHARSAQARRAFEPLRGQIDLVLQIGPFLTPPCPGEIPYALYCDWNMALSIRNRTNPHSAVNQMSAKEADAINRRHAEIYRGAATVFTMSERLRQSFIDDYDLAPDQVVTVRAGANFDLDRIPPRNWERGTGHRPTVLFIGKEFERKGGDLILKAFARLRKEFPDARLLIAGPRELDLREPGVELLGLLRKEVPEEMARLIAAYQEADVFCLPTRQEPLGIVVVEAMLFGLPCVTSNIWAMPEMVAEGETGFTVPPDDVDLIADRLARVLRDPLLARRMGEAGRERAQERYTWRSTARAMHDRIEAIVAAHREGSRPSARLMPVVPG